MRVKSAGQEARSEGTAHIAIIGTESSSARSVSEEDTQPGLDSVVETSATDTATAPRQRSVPVTASRSAGSYHAGMVRVRLRFPQGGVALDYRTTAAIADRIATELGRYGIVVTIDGDLTTALRDLPTDDIWSARGGEISADAERPAPTG
ncbi:hypothetical protein [Nocardia rhizosphaerihabitans]|uniref:Uncharacterized protein n=1 Tax=Nocardia rhizosphaerihabitans TaxID=1691570 RepID=A0ABQ2L1D1_9NOCA|nr:hypothetical protein GCM10011610_67210 [Nocardia rhizosphaerihabitans]